MARAREQVQGVVEARNERGVRLAGQWYNYSRWAEEIQPHEVGTHVTLDLDGSGFIRKLTASAAPAPTPASTPAVPAAVSAGSAQGGARQLNAEEYTRLRVLELVVSNVQALAGGADITPDLVMDWADSLLLWLRGVER